ncbi:HNH endonuclease [Bradyrhizobium liaoningense]|uniref:HNH endonuclease n=1 Tax=Bradyrhizobium liaoningense TaxID=43992 RepID=UPI001BA596CB|nr:HNH endonuclease [Bradyrhizobium liaoningense]MBR0714053.1 HNH endonuclease [Bradyrhizobium liaoningense]
MVYDEVERWRGSARWRRRVRFQLATNPLCRMCAEQGVVASATVVDHVIPHRGDQQLFWFGDLASLCASHHSKDKQQAETKGYTTAIGADGYPTDVQHPFYRAGCAETKRHPGGE